MYLPSLTLTEWLGVLGFFLSIALLIVQALHLYFDRKKEEKRKPKLFIRLDGSMHGHPSKKELGFEIRPDARITNMGELPTTISEVRVQGVSVRTKTEQTEGLVKLEPIRIEGKETISFKEPLFCIAPFPEEDCYLCLMIYYTEGSAESNEVVSKYHEILVPSSAFKKPIN